MVREAIKTLERELRDESVSRKTAERQIVQLYDHIEALCTRLTVLEKRIEDLESGCDDPNCKYYRKDGGRGGGDGDTGDSFKPVNITPPSTPPPHSHSFSPIPPPTPPTPLSLRVSVSGIPEYLNNGAKPHRLSAGLVPYTGGNNSPTSSHATPISPPAAAPSAVVSPTPNFPTPGSPKAAVAQPYGGSAAIRAMSANNLHLLLSTPTKNGKDKDDEDEPKEETTKEAGILNT